MTATHLPDAKHLHALHIQGMTFDAIATQYGVSSKTIARRVAIYRNTSKPPSRSRRRKTGCDVCSTLKAAVAHARGDLGDVKGKLVRAQRPGIADFPDTAARIAQLSAEAKTYRRQLAQAQIDLDAHLADGHADQETTPPPASPKPTTPDEPIDIITWQPPDWTEHALCAQTDPEAFFPEKGGSTRLAKLVCHSCSVRGDCLQSALDNQERFGIWGGLSERERRRLTPRRTA